jgi:hypothetical protein
MELRLTDLRDMHPNLLWDEIVGAAVAVLTESRGVRVVPMAISYDNVPGFGSEDTILRIDTTGVSKKFLARLKVTYEQAHLVELAAIAIAGLALYHGGRHEIRDVAIRGSGADYLVGDSLALLEIAGRSRRKDFDAAWLARKERLDQFGVKGYFLIVVEFETPRAQLAFLQ